MAGDFFKLCYFLFSMIGSDDDTEGGTSNNVFALGCLLSISLDSIVICNDSNGLVVSTARSTAMAATNNAFGTALEGEQR